MRRITPSRLFQSNHIYSVQMDHDSHSGTEMYYSDSSVRISSKHSSENEQFVMEVDTMRRQSSKSLLFVEKSHIVDVMSVIPYNPIL